jgi:hypothetical protein
MKNIHIIPTDKPSKLYTIKGKYYIEEYPVKSVNAGNQNIYITSDKEIKEGDWCIHLTTLNISKHHSKDNNLTQGWNKIILTTDPNLIKYGVQGIPDDFLEWFVKNPSCEFVDVKKESHIEIEEVSYEGDFQNVEYISYKIIIPKEEPKQETLEEAADTSSSPVLITKK